jgi:hypothetical protein
VYNPNSQKPIHAGRHHIKAKPIIEPIILRWSLIKLEPFLKTSLTCEGLNSEHIILGFKNLDTGKQLWQFWQYRLDVAKWDNFLDFFVMELFGLSRGFGLFRQVLEKRNDGASFSCGHLHWNLLGARLRVNRDILEVLKGNGVKSL